VFACLLLLLFVFVCCLFVDEWWVLVGVRRYRKMLAGFGKVWVSSGSTVVGEVSFNVTTLGHWDPLRNVHVVDPGEYSIMLCQNSVSPCLSQTITLPAS
jgi:hypothetical protein